MPLFGPPDVRNLEKRGYIKGLIKALRYRRDSASQGEPAQKAARVRGSAAMALAKTGSQLALEPLIEALDDGNEQVRRSAERGWI